MIPFSPPSIGEEEIKAVGQVLKSGWLTMGPEVLKFEDHFKKFYKTKNALAVSSATAGIHLALVGLNISHRDEVILPSYTFASCANTIVWTGAKPVFTDIKKEGFLIDPEEIKRKITHKTKAIMVVHFGGQMAEMDEIVKIARQKNLKIIEDCAHSLAATFQGKLAGTIGDVGVFSFYPTKNITTGEGGMVITKDDQSAEKIQVLRLHGMSTDAFNRYSSKGRWYYEISQAGFKYNMTDIAAAIGIVQLTKLKTMDQLRLKIAQTYLKNLQGVPGLTLPISLPERKNVWHLFPILVEPNLREKLIDALREFNVSSSVHFIPLHLQPFYQKNYGYKKGDLPVSEEVFEREISLPIYPKLTISQVEYICQVIKYFMENQ